MRMRNASLSITVQYDLEEISHFDNVMIYAGPGSNGEEMDKNRKFAKRTFLITEAQYRVRRGQR